MTEQTRLSDEEIFEQVCAGELPLYGILMERHRRWLYYKAWRILKNPEDAEEAVQEAHIRALTHRDQFLRKSSLAAWLTRILINEALTILRTRRSFPALELASGKERTGVLCISAGPHPESEAMRQESSALLNEALGALPGKYREIFELRELESLSVSEAIGPLAGWIAAALENQGIFGGLDAFGGALYSLGFPRDGVLRYEAALNAGACLVVVHGAANEVAQARGIPGHVHLPRSGR